MFNMSNSEAWAANPQVVKPDFQEVGPYVFQEVRERVGVEFNGTTVAFNQTRTWHFRPELSGNLTLEDQITNVNVVSATLNYNLRFLSTFQRELAHIILDPMGSLLTTRSVRELVFDGYKDNQLDYLNKVSHIIPNVPVIPLAKFGWFVQRNLSATHDGRMEINSGHQNIFKLGMLKRWNGKNHTKYFPLSCGNVTGTTGELWPPMKDGTQPVTMYIVDICRPLTFQPVSNVTKFGMKGVKYAGNRKTLDGMETDVDTTSCWCLADNCPDLAPGVFNASTCQFGAPAFMSYPHFYLADSSYTSTISGMKPNASKHEFYISLDPQYGVPLEIRARLQVNVMVRNEPTSSLYKHVPTTFIPMFWFSQVADITEDLAKQAGVMNVVREAGVWGSYAVSAVGLLLLVIGIRLALKGDSEMGEDDDVAPILSNAVEPPAANV